MEFGIAVQMYLAAGFWQLAAGIPLPYFAAFKNIFKDSSM